MFDGRTHLVRTTAAALLVAFGIAVGAVLAPLTGVGSDHALAQEANAARYWEQLTALLEPVPMPAMTDHRAYMLPDGVIVALHFDNLDLSRAQNLNWVALGFPGRFCASDKQRLEGSVGRGFTHFHDMANDTHGGAPGADGVWFVHTAVRSFDSPMSGGPVTPGVDMNFMPTPAPDC